MDSAYEDCREAPDHCNRMTSVRFKWGSDTALGDCEQISLPLALEKSNEPATRMHLVDRKSILCAVCLMMAGSASLSAQSPLTDGVYHLLDQRTPPGMAARWSGIIGRITPGYFQPVQIELPEPGSVTFFDGSRNRPVDLKNPQKVRLAVGEVYRLRIGGMKSFPGIDLYPSVELFGHLHPPRGSHDDYPVPIEFTEEEIRFALDGRMVTKVVYVEQPELAAPFDTPSPLPVRSIANHKNLIAEADRVGRPVAVIRLGSRVPDASAADAGFFGSGAPVQVVASRADANR